MFEWENIFLLICVAPKEELLAALQKTGQAKHVRKQSKAERVLTSLYAGSYLK